MRPHLQGGVLGHTPPIENIVVSLWPSKERSIPTDFAAVLKAETAAKYAVVPVAYMNRKLSFLFLGIPLPHSDGPLPGCLHTSTPPGPFFHPWLRRSFSASCRLYG